MRSQSQWRGLALLVSLMAPVSAQHNGLLTLFGAGCCRFKDYVATDHGIKTADECKQMCQNDDSCVAMDYRPDTDGTEFVCTTFALSPGYAMAENFDTSCDTSGSGKHWCYRKDECMRDDLAFLDNGCCRFNTLGGASHAQPMGSQTEEACLAYCNEDENCVAADVRYPDPELPFLEENVTYVCYNFYGSLINVETHCKTDNINERCYVKPCLAATTTTTTCILDDLVFLDNGCCRFNHIGWAQPMGAQTEEACLAYCNENPLCIAADVRYPDPELPFLEENVTYICFNFYGDGHNFETFCKTDNFNERCYKKPCAGGTTTTTTCILDDLVFLDNGCCRFNHIGWAQPMGAQTEEACLAYCNENPLCIAADVRYPDPELPFLEENVTYICFNFYGDGHNFETFCKTDNFNERCYKKPCAGGTTTTTTCVLDDLVFLDNGCCRFNHIGWAQPMGAQTEEACLAYCNENPLCIAADVRYPDPELPFLEENVTYICFNFYGDGHNFETFCKTDNFNERCYKKPCVGGTTTTTTCVLDDLVFLDNGCCRFNHIGWAQPMGAQTEEACLAYCNENPLCIAADVRYPDPELPFLEENVTYICFNFYGDGHNFETFCKTDNFNERCYKKPCVGGTTTTTTCVLDDLVFLDNGCCRFNHIGWAQPMGAQTEEACLAYCNENPLCIAADVRYPDPELPFLEENVTYICFNFYGDGHNFETFCKTDNFNERCYKKPCAGGTTTTTTCVLDDLVFLDNGCCRFNHIGWAQPMGAQTEEACLAYCNENPLCIAADVRYPDPELPFLEENVTYICFNFYGDGHNFETFCKTDNFNERCYKKPCVGGTTTTTTCVLDDLVFLDNGCCRFNHIGWAQPLGAQTEEACLAYCNENPLCIAADVRYPDPELPFLEENVTYICFNFYGDGKNFDTHCRTDNINERCYKKPCVGGTTTTTTCILEDLVFLDNGCCRFNHIGWAQPLGAQTEEACLAYCNENPLCIAADVRYPDPELPFLEENVTYICFNFYGDGKNFDTHCRTDNINERCYKKPCAGGTTTTTTCVLEDLVFLDNGCCRFNHIGWAQPMGAQTEEACLAYCNENPLCIAADVRYPDPELPFLEENVTYICFNFYGDGKNFDTHCRTDNINERCYKKPCAGPTTTTTTCVLEDLAFLDNGCCRFNHIGWAQPMGAQTEEACLAYCNENPLCIAADVRYPDPEMPFLEENVTYICFNFYGEGINFDTHCKTDNFNERCYKKPCAGPTTTTTTCVLDDLVFLDNGCCRFNHIGWAQPMGAQTEEACLAYCNENPLCIAADVRYPDPELPFLEENVTYICFNFYGDGHNFETHCKTDNINERCYKKPCTTATTTCVYQDLEFVDNGCCRFNGLNLDYFAQNQGAQTEEACLAYCNENPLCIAADIRYPDPEMPFLEENVTYICYNFYGGGQHFDTFCKTDNINERCYKKPCRSFGGYTALGSGVCASSNGQRVQYCQNLGVTPEQCKAKCDSMSNCMGFNPNTHDHSNGGQCFIFYSGTWDGAGFENGGCHSTGNGNLIMGHDSTEGGTCYKKDYYSKKDTNGIASTTTTTPAVTEAATAITDTAAASTAAPTAQEAATEESAAFHAAGAWAMFLAVVLAWTA